MPILGALLSGLLTWLGGLFGELMVRRIANNLCSLAFSWLRSLRWSH